MALASGVFGPKHKKVTLYMGWQGRGETPTQIASRLLPTMQVLAGRYPEGGAAFYALQGQNHDQPVPLPGTLDELAAYADSKSDKDNNGDSWEKGTTRLVSLLLPDPSDPALNSDAMLSLAAGTPLAHDNNIVLRFEDNFPLGTPAEAAHWFLDLVRIWQPEYALLKTSLTNRTYTANGTYAGYLSWASTKGLHQLPDVPSAIRIPFGDGALYAAREWAISGIAAFIEDLRNVGATSIYDLPPTQRPPIFPEGYPDGLERLDDLVTWGPDLEAESAG